MKPAIWVSCRFLVLHVDSGLRFERRVNRRSPYWDNNSPVEPVRLCHLVYLKTQWTTGGIELGFDTCTFCSISCGNFFGDHMLGENNEGGPQTLATARNWKTLDLRDLTSLCK